MSSYYLPDITGKDPEYLLVNLPFNIYKNNISLAFENSPVFASSLRLAMTDGTGTLLVKDQDWTVQDSDIDHTAMSRAFLENPNFTETLIRSFTIISTKAVGQQIAATAQEFYLTQPGRMFDDGTPFEVTPDVIRSLVIGQTDLKQQAAKVSSPVVPNNNTPSLLPFDINGEKSGNLVANEIVTVNTVAGAKIIRLSKGSFFADSLSLKYNGKTLSVDTDYQPMVVSPLTKRTTNKSGIYHYILLLTPVTGTVSISYRAVGGEVQIDDVNALNDLMVAIKTFLNNGTFVTNSTVSQTSAFKALHSRTTQLETIVRNLVSGTPTYGDATGGSVVRRPVSASDANLHWYTIASLYQIEGSSDIITADRFKARVYFPTAKVSLTFTLDVNLTQTRNPASFTTDNLVFDPTYTLFVDQSVAAPVYPMVRLVWSQVSQAYAGASIQIGIPLTALNDQMIVEDLSTNQSCWLLDKTNLYVAGVPSSPSAPLDNNFTLPDGHTVWSSASSSSYSKIFVPEYKAGYLVYSGFNVTLNQLVTTSSTASLFNIALPPYFPTANTTSLIVTMMSSSDNNVIYDVTIPLPAARTGVRSGQQSFTDTVGNTDILSATFSQSSANGITLSLNVKSVSTSGIPMTDIVRYVRAKV